VAQSKALQKRALNIILPDGENGTNLIIANIKTLSLDGIYSDTDSFSLDSRDFCGHGPPQNPPLSQLKVVTISLGELL